VLKSVLPASLSTSVSKTLAAFAAMGYVPTATTDYARYNAPQNMLTDQHSASAQIDYDLGFADSPQSAPTATGTSTHCRTAMARRWTSSR